MKKSKEEIQYKINELEGELARLQKELTLIENNENINPEFKNYIGKWVKYKTGVSLAYFYVKDVEINEYDELILIGFGVDYFKNAIMFLGSEDFDHDICIEYPEGLEIVNTNEYNFVVHEFLDYIKGEIIEFIKRKRLA